MLKNFIRSAWRNLRRDRQFTFLNLVGLSAGLACTLAIYLWVKNELEVDKFHANDSRLYQVMEHEQINGNIVVEHRTSGLLAEALAAEMPEVELATAVMHYSWFPRFIVSVDGTNKIKAVGQFAGKDFFNLFSYELLQGKAAHVLTDKHAVVISEQLALKLFNTTVNVVGKTITWQLGPYTKEVVLSGIFKTIPSNSSEQFDFVLSFEEFKDINPAVLHWGNDGTHTYVLVKNGTDISRLNARIEDLLKTKLPGTSRSPFLKRFSENYLYGKYENGIQAGGRIEYVRLMSVIAVFILVIACINFMNLSTAKASRRIKETGIKKVVGASRSSLVWQFLGESMLMSCLSMLVAIFLVAILLPAFNSITGQQIELRLNGRLVSAMFLITVVTGLLSGSYPALYLSRFNPVTVLKGQLKHSVAELWVRRGLVVFQFTLSVLFIVSVLVVYKQIKLVQTKNLGYNRENIVYFEKEGALNDNLESFLQEVKKLPGVINASSADHLITGGHNSTGNMSWPGKDPNQSLTYEVVHVNYDMIETFGITMKEGRSFSRDFGADTNRIIFNETAIRMMGLENPVGTTVGMWGRDWEIAGVAKDFHFESLHTNVKPLFFILQPEHTHFVMVRILAGNEVKSIGHLQKTYAAFNPGYHFDYKFLDENYQRLYESERRMAVLSRYFAGLTILISCLGLFGLAAFTAQKRQKEIGIRKVVGASVGNIVVMLSGNFVKLVLLSMLIAFPLAWWSMNSWLNNFAYRTSIGLDVFIAAGIIIMLITLLTISFQALRAAMANPTSSLRSE